MKKLLVFILSLIFGVATANAWFDTPPGGHGKVVITRIEHYNTSTISAPWEIEDHYTTDYTTTNFFDYNIDPPDNETFIPDHVAGPVNPNPFYTAYPVNIHVWVQNAALSPSTYTVATLEYATTTDGSADAADWVEFARITEFLPVNGIEGAHFGIVTWTPPVTTDTMYLIRFWAQLANGMESSDKSEDSLTKNGGGTTWYDYEVVLIKVANRKKPGVFTFKAPPTTVTEYDRPPVLEDFPSGDPEIVKENASKELKKKIFQISLWIILLFMLNIYIINKIKRRKK